MVRYGSVFNVKRWNGRIDKCFSGVVFCVCCYCCCWMMMHATLLEQYLLFESIKSYFERDWCYSYIDVDCTFHMPKEMRKMKEVETTSFAIHSNNYLLYNQRIFSMLWLNAIRIPHQWNVWVQFVDIFKGLESLCTLFHRIGKFHQIEVRFASCFFLRIDGIGRMVEVGFIMRFFCYCGRHPNANEIIRNNNCAARICTQQCNATKPLSDNFNTL